MDETVPRRLSRRIKPAFSNGDWILDAPTKSKQSLSTKSRQLESTTSTAKSKQIKSSKSSDLPKKFESSKSSDRPKQIESSTKSKELESFTLSTNSVQLETPTLSTKPIEPSTLSTKSKKFKSSTLSTKSKQLKSSTLSTKLKKLKSTTKPKQLKSLTTKSKKLKSPKLVAQKKQLKSSTSNLDAGLNEFTCSACNQKFTTRKLANHHVLTAHYGLARLNDTNNEFSERDTLIAYKEAIKLLKSLKCSICDKAFKSALGLKCHLEICGVNVEELLRKCEICGSMLKFRSLKSHLEIHKREDFKRQEAEENLNDCIEESLKRPIRKSAKKAIEFLKSTAEEDSDQETGRKRKNRKRDDSFVDSSSDDNSEKLSDQISSSNHLADIESMETFGSKNGLSLIRTNISLRQSKRGPLPNVPFTMIETENFYNDYFSESTFEEWLFDEKSILFLNETELENYLPEKKSSAKFKFKTIQGQRNNQMNETIQNGMINGEECDSQLNKSMNEWKTLNLFESLASSKHHTTIYTGGPVYSGAWCPFPNNAETEFDQILCLATNVKNRIFNVFDCNPNPGLLQFWSFGTLKHNQTRNVQNSKLEFAIAHNYSTIFDMAWCPGGTSYISKSSDNSNGRLGLLAIACSDGHIRILSIPLVDDLARLCSDELKVFKCKPIIILDKHPIGQSVFNKSTICKTLSWSLTDQQRFIAAGYGNGLASIFDLQTKSSLLKKLNSNGTIELKPKKNWIAHGAIINSIKWLPLSDCSYLVTTSLDRLIKIWCLEDQITHITLPKRSIITNIEWLPKYTGCFMSHDDGYSILHNNIMFKSCGPFNFSNSLTRHKSCVWDFNISSWSNVEVGVDSAGEAILSVYVTPKDGKKYNKSRPFECLPVYRLTYESLDDQQSDDNRQSADASDEVIEKDGTIDYLIDKNKPLKSTLDEMINSYGLVFNEIDLSLYRNVPISETNRLKSCETMSYPRLGDYPLSSLNKCQWNPNKSSYNWLFTAGESGLTRISHVQFLADLKFSIHTVEKKY